MPHKDPEARRVYLLANKDKIAARQRAYRIANADKINEKAKLYEIAYKSKRALIDAKPENKSRRREYARQYTRDNPERTREYNQKIKTKRANTEPTQIHNRELMAGRPRPDKCEICSKATKRIVFDHCHQHGHFRGWLCERCNHALGMVQDDVQHLRKLIAYLERNRTSTAPQLVLSGI